MSKLALMGRALMSTPAALNPLRRLTLTRRFSADAGGDQTFPPPPLVAEQPPPPPPPVEAAQQDQTPPLPIEAAAQPQDQAPPPPPQDASHVPFHPGFGEGWVYGRLIGVGKNTMKTDVLHLLEGSNLSIDDVKVEYNRALNPVAMMLRFPSSSSYETAVKKVIRMGQLYRLDVIRGLVWDSTSTFNGRTVLLRGLPRNVLPEDIERFLSGFNFDPSSIQNFRTNPGSKAVLVSFQSRLDAMNALTAKNRSFCLNNPITMRILH